MARFDLTEEPWLPIVDADGTARETGLREALKAAHQLREIHSDSPLEILSLNRLLLALAIWIFPQTQDEDTWFAIWEQGHFDAETIDRYFDQHSEQFDLLHPTRPFYQHRAPMSSESSPLARLFSHESRGNNPTLFDHTVDDVRREMSLARAARGIVTTQGTALVDGISKPIHCFAAPVTDGGIIFWLRGHSLFEALMLNAPPIKNGRMGGRRENDKPAWESNPIDSKERNLNGYLDYLTWQTRRILLVTEQKEDGSIVATRAWVSAGDKVADESIDDPLMAYTIHKERGKLPVRLGRERAVWRDYPALLRQSTSEGARSPVTLSWLGSERTSLPDQEWFINAFGLIKDKANLQLWRCERLPFFPSYFRSGELQEIVSQALDEAEHQARMLWSAGARLGARVLFPTREPDGLSPESRERIKDFVKALAIEGRYWSKLEVPFYSFLETLAMADDRIIEVLQQWRDTIHQTALSAFTSSTTNLETTAQQLRGLAEASSFIEHISTVTAQ